MCRVKFADCLSNEAVPHSSHEKRLGPENLSREKENLLKAALIQPA
jgi:hypothetical protein